MHKPKLLLIDNEDSFTFNLLQLFEEAGAEIHIVHPAKINTAQALLFDAAVISPGPGLPEEMQNLLPLIQNLEKKMPLLGICLGHQAIAMNYGGKLFQMNNIFHGRQLEITHYSGKLFRDIPAEINVGLYHSWAVDNDSIPDCFEVTAISSEGIIMAIEHRELPVFGLQFHPESYITRETGSTIAKNFLSVVEEHKTSKTEKD